MILREPALQGVVALLSLVVCKSVPHAQKRVPTTDNPLLTLEHHEATDGREHQQVHHGHHPGARRGEAQQGRGGRHRSRDLRLGGILHLSDAKLASN